MFTPLGWMSLGSMQASFLNLVALSCYAFPIEMWSLLRNWWFMGFVYVFQSRFQLRNDLVEYYNSVIWDVWCKEQKINISRETEKLPKKTNEAISIERCTIVTSVYKKKVHKRGTLRKKWIIKIVRWRWGIKKRFIQSFNQYSCSTRF